MAGCFYEQSGGICPSFACLYIYTAAYSDLCKNRNIQGKRGYEGISYIVSYNSCRIWSCEESGLRNLIKIYIGIFQSQTDLGYPYFYEIWMQFVL